MLWSVAAASGCAAGASARANDARGPGEAAGALATGQLQQPLSTEASRAGDRFTVELLDPVVDADGREVIGRGALLEGIVRRDARGPAVSGLEPLTLELVGVRVPGEALLPVQAEVASAPVEGPPVWGPGLVGVLAGAAAGSGAGLAIDHDSAGTVLGSAIVGAGLGALGAVLFGPRRGTVPAGSILTLRFGGDLRRAAAVLGRRPGVVPARSRAGPQERVEPASVGEAPGAGQGSPAGD
jgi:hypothetical protein